MKKSPAVKIIICIIAIAVIVTQIVIFGVPKFKSMLNAKISDTDTVSTNTIAATLAGNEIRITTAPAEIITEPVENTTVSNKGLGSSISIKYKVNTASSPLNLRQGPGENYPVIFYIPKGTEITGKLRSFDGKWICVDYKGFEGWVSVKYLAPLP